MRIHVSFHSYFKDMAGCAGVTEEVPPGATIADLLETIYSHFPKLAVMRKSALVAVGVEYQGKNYVLKESDEVALFPPVQGG